MNMNDDEYYDRRTPAVIDRMVDRKAKPCSQCSELWNPVNLDECVACGLGAGTIGICPKCMRDHKCQTSSASTSS